MTIFTEPQLRRNNKLKSNTVGKLGEIAIKGGRTIISHGRNNVLDRKWQVGTELKFNKGKGKLCRIKLQKFVGLVGFFGTACFEVNF